MNPQNKRTNRRFSLTPSDHPLHLAKDLRSFECNGATRTEPFDNLSGCPEPGIERLQFVDQSHIKVSPEPFGSVTSVVPKDRQHAAICPRPTDKDITHLPCFVLRQIKPLGIKE